MKPPFFATIGTFDGVHRGHRLLLSRLTHRAAELSLTPAAFVITTHPLALIAPERVPPRLSTFEMRREMIEALGVKVSPLVFDQATRSLTSAEFMAKIVDEFGVKGLLTGHDNRFGTDRSATFADYRRQGEALGITVEEAPALPGISSSAVRKTILAGNMAEAARMLGRNYTVEGTVVHGAHLGSRLGFPTANLKPAHPELLVPPFGVYITEAGIEGEPYPLTGVTNIGIRPTVTGEAGTLPSIETHLPGFNRDIYSHRISLGFIDKIRDEQRFASLDKLKERIALDTEFAINYKHP